jgi:biopolymer transport protein TolR
MGMARLKCLEKGFRPSVAMHRRTTRRRSTYYSWMDVSALLAVFLVIFISLAVSPVGNRGSDGAGVDLFKSANSRLLPRAIREDAMRVAVTRDGKLYFGNRRVSPEELAEQIRNSVRGGAENRVYFMVDARGSYADVKLAIEQVSLARVKNISFLTFPVRLQPTGSEPMAPEPGRSHGVSG